MTAGHHHPARPVAASPTLSLLRLSAAQRVAGAAVVIGVLWLMVLAAI